MHDYNGSMLNDWKPYEIIPFKDYELATPPSQRFYYVVLRVPNMVNYEIFEGTYDECEKECNELNQRIHISLSLHLMKKNDDKKEKKSDNITSSVRSICPCCCYSDGRENHEDGSWYCWRCGDNGEP